MVNGRPTRTAPPRARPGPVTLPRALTVPRRGTWGPATRAQAVDLGIWAVAAAAGLLLTALITASGVDLGARSDHAAAPFQQAWRTPAVAPAVLLPILVAVVTLLLAGRSTHIRWSALLVGSFAGSLGWSLALATAAGPGLAGGLRPPAAYLGAADAVGDDPLAYLASWTSQVSDLGPGLDGSGATGGGGSQLAGHPPGPVLLVWALDRLGISGATTLGLALTALTALSVPLMAIAVRSLCHETAARRAVPVLVLTPWALWAAASPHAVTVLPAAAALAVGVVGCEPGRRWRLLWALASGLLLGVTSLFDYPAVWLGVGVAAAYFVRRRPLMNVLTGLGALLPFWLFLAWGFSWSDGLAAARVDAGIATMLAWLALDIVVVLLAGGPVLIRALRRLRLTPGWPFLVGAAAAALFSLCAGLAWSGTELSWLPLAPWLAVAALAPRPRPDGPGDTIRAGDLPLLLVGAGALVAVVLRMCLSST